MKSWVGTVTNLCSVLMTAAPSIVVVALILVFAHVRFLLGRWPVVYKDNVDDWFVISAGTLALYAYLLSLAALVLWIPATGLAAVFAGRAMFLRRLLVFVLGWALLCSIYAFDPTGSLEWFLD